MTSLFSLSGKRALVTGGATGIGRMIAETLVGAGAEVMICSRREERCLSAAKDIEALDLPGKISGFGGDVSSEAAIRALIAETEGRGDGLDILVNNAGIAWGAPIETFPHDQWERVMNVNVSGLFTLTRGLLPQLRARARDDDPARVINLGSVMGTVPFAEGAYSYAVSKASVHHLTRILAGELAAERITVNALAPGPFPSAMTAFATGTREGERRVAENVPLGRVGRAEDVGGATVFLCSRAGSYVSGAVLPLDGGMSARGRELFSNAI
ncbi:MAG: SDR family oxidoreductase [Pseudomonadota bacterium]